MAQKPFGVSQSLLILLLLFPNDFVNANKNDKKCSPNVLKISWVKSLRFDPFLLKKLTAFYIDIIHSNFTDISVP